MKRQLITYLGSYPADSRFPFKPAVALAPLDSHCTLSKHKAIFCSNSSRNLSTNSVQHFPLSIEFPLGILRESRNHGRRKRDRNVERNDIGAPHTVFGAVREPMNEFTIRTPVDLRGTLWELRTYTATCLTSTLRHWIARKIFTQSISPPTSYTSSDFSAREIHSGAIFIPLFYRPLVYTWGVWPTQSSYISMVPETVLLLMSSGARSINSLTPNECMLSTHRATVFSFTFEKSLLPPVWYLSNLSSIWSKN